MLASRVRTVVGEDAVIGVSVHGTAELREAEEEGADYVFLGPVYDTPSKRGILPPLGVDRFSELAASTPLPVYAIGGIRPGRIAPLRAAGAEGVAVLSFLMSSSNPERDVRAILEEVNP